MVQEMLRRPVDFDDRFGPAPAHSFTVGSGAAPPFSPQAEQIIESVRALNGRYPSEKADTRKRRKAN